jgi:hypothetical protein
MHENVGTKEGGGGGSRSGGGGGADARRSGGTEVALHTLGVIGGAFVSQQKNTHTHAHALQLFDGSEVSPHDLRQASWQSDMVLPARAFSLSLSLSLAPSLFLSLALSLSLSL